VITVEESQWVVAYRVFCFSSNLLVKCKHLFSVLKVTEIDVLWINLISNGLTCEDSPDFVYHRRMDVNGESIEENGGRLRLYRHGEIDEEVKLDASYLSGKGTWERDVSTYLDSHIMMTSSTTCNY
jgi:hypothetical protein